MRFLFGYRHIPKDRSTTRLLTFHGSFATLQPFCRLPRLNTNKPCRCIARIRIAVIFVYIRMNLSQEMTGSQRKRCVGFMWTTNSIYWAFHVGLFWDKPSRRFLTHIRLGFLGSSTDPFPSKKVGCTAVVAPVILAQLKGWNIKEGAIHPKDLLLFILGEPESMKTRPCASMKGLFWTWRLRVANKKQDCFEKNRWLRTINFLMW